MLVVEGTGSMMSGKGSGRLGRFFAAYSAADSVLSNLGKGEDAAEDSNEGLDNFLSPDLTA